MISISKQCTDTQTSFCPIIPRSQCFKNGSIGAAHTHVSKRPYEVATTAFPLGELHSSASKWSDEIVCMGNAKCAFLQCEFV